MKSRTLKIRVTAGICATLLLSCESRNQPSLDASTVNRNIGKEDVWVCYHPGTKYHEKICVEDYYPHGCYVKGSNSQFCWKLTKDMCTPAHEDQPWASYCESL